MQEQFLRDEVANLIENWLAKDKKRTLKQLSAESGIAATYLTAMRLGMRNASLNKLCKLLDYLGYDLEITKKGY